MSECPGDVVEIDAATDPRVLIDVARIVVVNEVVVESLTKNNPGECREKDADNYIYPPAGRFGGSYRSGAESVHVRRCDCEGGAEPF